jgi:hypothetical protein
MYGIARKLTFKTAIYSAPHDKMCRIAGNKLKTC